MRKMTFGKGKQLSRRKFIVGSAASPAADWRSDFNVPFAHRQPGAERRRRNEVNAWVAIKPDDTCVIRIARSEMGQGTLTGLAQLVAEELECDWRKVTTEAITPGRNLARKRAWGEMGTGGSRGIRTSQDYVRRGGAAARIDAAAGGGRPVEGAGRRAHRVEGRHHPRGVASARPATARSRRPRPR